MYIHSIYNQEHSMIVEFRKWGNSLAVRIPKALADAIKASDGKRAEIKVENGTLVLRPTSSRRVNCATRLMNCSAA